MTTKQARQLRNLHLSSPNLSENVIFWYKLLFTALALSRAPRRRGSTLGWDSELPDCSDSAGAGVGASFKKTSSFSLPPNSCSTMRRFPLHLWNKKPLTALMHPVDRSISNTSRTVFCSSQVLSVSHLHEGTKETH